MMWGGCAECYFIPNLLTCSVIPNVRCCDFCRRPMTTDTSIPRCFAEARGKTLKTKTRPLGFSNDTSLCLTWSHCIQILC